MQITPTILGLGLLSVAKGGTETCITKVGDDPNEQLKLRFTSDTQNGENVTICEYKNYKDYNGSTLINKQLLENTFSLNSRNCSARTTIIPFTWPEGNTGDGGGNNPEEHEEFWRCKTDSDGTVSRISKLATDFDFLHEDKKCVVTGNFNFDKNGGQDLSNEEPASSANQASISHLLALPVVSIATLSYRY